MMGKYRFWSLLAEGSDPSTAVYQHMSLWGLCFPIFKMGKVISFLESREG